MLAKGTEVGQHEEDAEFLIQELKPPFLWSFGLVLLCSVPSVARMAWLVTGLDGDCCQLVVKAQCPFCFGSWFGELLWEKEVLGIYN